MSIRKFPLCSQLVWAALVCCWTPSFGQDTAEDTAARPEVTVADIRQNEPEFYIHVSVDHESREYVAGEQMTVTVRPEIDCYIYVEYVQADGKTYQIFPNKAQPENFVRGDHDVVIPALDDLFRWTVGPPFGKERIKVIGREQPIQALSAPKLRSERFNLVTEDDLKSVCGELGCPVGNSSPQDSSRLPIEAPVSTRDSKGRYGETAIEIVTKPNSDSTPQRGAKRFGVFFGVSKHKFSSEMMAVYKASDDLQCPHRDAEYLRDALKAAGKLDEVQLFVNGDATRANLEKMITKHLPNVTQPGDTVIIYFSGHGGRIPDQKDGDERDDHFDEYMVTHDCFSTAELLALMKRHDQNALPQQFEPWRREALSIVQERFGAVVGRGDRVDLSKLDEAQWGELDQHFIRNSAVTDDLMGRWLQELNGCKVVVILDICLSGGFANVEKGVGSNAANDAQTFDFLDQEMARLKDIGQKDQILLAACPAHESSLEGLKSEDRPHLSVMTFELIALIQEHQGPLDVFTCHKLLDERMHVYFDKVQPLLDRINASLPKENHNKPHFPVIFPTDGEALYLKL